MQWIVAITAMSTLSFNYLHACPLNHLTVKDKVGQILTAHFNDSEVNNDAKALINEYQELVSKEYTLHIGDLIWDNECEMTRNGLTTWRTSENFASLGIGHFIWYPEGVEQPFQTIFPDLLTFLMDNRVDLPEWLKNAKGCPWCSQSDFLEEFNSPKMIELRQLLHDTRDLQAQFIAKQLEKTLPEIERVTPREKTDDLKKVFYMMTASPEGLYAMIDYLNFKGMGIKPEETYNGEGWGLIQVLQKISLENQDIVEAFVKAAKVVLAKRVENAPSKNNEERWLKGWYARIDTYTHFNSKISFSAPHN